MSLNKNYIESTINHPYYYTPRYISYQVKSIFDKLGINNVNIVLHNNDKNIAYAEGINLGEFFNFSSIILYINFKRIQFFDPNELYFILAHECSHIYHNQMLGNIGTNLLEMMVKGVNKKNHPIAESLKSISTLFKNDFLPIDAEYIKNMELEADKFAVKNITQDLKSAVRCLLHLCNNHTERESHIWELYQVPFNIMSMGQRIKALISDLESVQVQSNLK
jgi:Zn-dependent protease with chaperone function